MRSGWSSARLNALLIITSVSECDRWNFWRATDWEKPVGFPMLLWTVEQCEMEDRFSMSESQLFFWRLVSMTATDWSISARFCEFRRPISDPVRPLLTRHGTLGDRNSPRTADVFPLSTSWWSSAFLKTESFADDGVFSLSSMTGENNNPERCLNRGGFPGTIGGDFMSPRNSASSSFSRVRKFLPCVSNELYRHTQKVFASTAWNFSPRTIFGFTIAEYQHLILISFTLTSVTVILVPSSTCLTVMSAWYICISRCEIKSQSRQLSIIYREKFTAALFCMPKFDRIFINVH